MTATPSIVTSTPLPLGSFTFGSVRCYPSCEDRLAKLSVLPLVGDDDRPSDDTPESDVAVPCDACKADVGIGEIAGTPARVGVLLRAAGVKSYMTTTGGNCPALYVNEGKDRTPGLSFFAVTAMDGYILLHKAESCQAWWEDEYTDLGEGRDLFSIREAADLIIAEHQ
jgi:hypothetical protein